MVRRTRTFAVAQRTEEAERVGDWAEVARCSRITIQSEQAGAPAYARLIQSLTVLGDNDQARRAIHEAACELGQEWAGEQIRMLEREEADRGIAVFKEGRFVGRAAEFASLRSRWDRAKSGGASLLLIKGEAGIGKTRLAQQFCKLAVIQGGRLLTCRCFEAGHRVSYAALEAIAADLPDSVTARLNPGCGRTLAILSGRDQVQHSALTPDEFRYRDDAIIHTFVQVVAELTRDAPLVFCIDDCQWLDTATADLLVYLSGRIPNARVVFVCVARNDTAGSKGLQAIENSAHECITLTELNTAESMSLVRAYASAQSIDVAESCMQELVKLACGNPFFLLELLAARNAHNGASARPVPRSITKLIERKFGELSKEAQLLAAAAAVIDSPMGTRILRRIAGLSKGPSIGPIEELYKTGLLGECAGPAVTLKHDLIRETIYSLVSPRARRLLHGRAAAVLARRNAPAALIAYHADIAGLRRKAYSYAVAAGDHALMVSAHRDAIHWYEVAYGKSDSCHERAVVCKRILAFAMSTGAPEQAMPYIDNFRDEFRSSGRRSGSTEMSSCGTGM